MGIAAEQRQNLLQNQPSFLSFCLREKLVSHYLLESLLRTCIKSIIKHHSPARSTLTLCRVSEICRVFTPDLRTDIHDYGRDENVVSPYLSSSDLFNCQVMHWELGLYYPVLLKQGKAEVGKRKLNSTVDQNPNKLIMIFTWFLVSKFTKILGLLLRLQVDVVE